MKQHCNSFAKYQAEFEPMCDCLTCWRKWTDKVGEMNYDLGFDDGTNYNPMRGE